MSDENFHTGKELQKLFADFKEYIEIQYDLFKIDISEKIVTFFTSFYSFFVLIVLIPFAMLFFSFAAAFYLSEILDSIVYGFIAVGLLYLALVLIFMLFRKIIITKPLVKMVVDMFFGKKNRDE